MNIFHGYVALALLLVGAPNLAQSPTPNPPFYGLARSIDGDSLTVDSREVRLFGIDAPEFDQQCKRGSATWSCGSEAAQRLMQLVTGKEVRCVSTGRDEYDRTLARCTVGTTDINAAMVESGYAVAYRHYSSDYVAAEGRAKAAKRGLWSGTFTMPSQVRAADRAEERGVASAPAMKFRTPGRADDWANRSNCRIKGNQNRRGQFIYHVPGMPYYDQTRPEQIFCTEAEARAAGYRRALVR